MFLVSSKAQEVFEKRKIERVRMYVSERGLFVKTEVRNSRTVVISMPRSRQIARSSVGVFIVSST